MTTGPTPPPSYSSNSSTKEARSEISDESFNEEGSRILKRGLSKVEAANIIRGASEKDRVVDLSKCEHSIQISACAENRFLVETGKEVTIIGFKPSEQDLEKIEKEFNEKKARRETELPHFDGSADTKWEAKSKASAKFLGAAATSWLVLPVGLYMSYKLAKSGYKDLKSPNRFEFNDEMISDAMRGKADRGDKNITLTGPDSHKSKLWLYATLEGLNAHGYRPSPEDKAALNKALQEREKSMPAIYLDAPEIPHRPKVTRTIEIPGQSQVSINQSYQYKGDSKELKDLCEQANADIKKVLEDASKLKYSDEERQAELVEIDKEFVKNFEDISRQEQRYQYDGDSDELKEVCAKANEEIERILENEEDYSDKELDDELSKVHKQFVTDFDHTSTPERRSTLQNHHEVYLKEHAEKQLEQIKDKFEERRTNQEKELEAKNEPEEVRESKREELKLREQTEISSLYGLTLSKEQNSLDNTVEDIQWGKGFDQSTFGTALVNNGLKFENGAFYRKNADDGDKKSRKPAVKLKLNGVLKFQEKPPKSETVEAVAKAAIGSGANSIKLKGSEEYKRMMWKACQLEAGIKGIPFHVDGYTPSKAEKDALDREIAEGRKKLNNTTSNKEKLSIETVDKEKLSIETVDKETLSIETVGDKKQTAKPVEIESIEPPNFQELPAPEGPTLSPKARVVRGGARPAPDPVSPDVSIPPSVSSRSSLSNPANEESPILRHRDSGLPDEEQSPSQEKIRGAVSREQSEPPIPSLHGDSGISMSPPASPTLTETAGDLNIDGKKTRSMEAALSREISRQDSIQSSVSDDHTKEALLSQSMDAARASISEAAIGSRPSTPIPDKQVTEGERYFFKVKEVVTNGEQKGAIIELHGAQQRPDQMEKRRFFVPEAMGGTKLVKGQVLGKEFSYNIDFVQSQKLNQGQRKGQGLSRSNSKRN